MEKVDRKKYRTLALSNIERSLLQDAEKNFQIKIQDASCIRAFTVSKMVICKQDDLMRKWTVSQDDQKNLCLFRPNFTILNSVPPLTRKEFWPKLNCDNDERFMACRNPLYQKLVEVILHNF